MGTVHVANHCGLSARTLPSSSSSLSVPRYSLYAGQGSVRVYVSRTLPRCLGVLTRGLVKRNLFPDGEVSSHSSLKRRVNHGLTISAVSSLRPSRRSPRSRRSKYGGVLRKTVTGGTFTPRAFSSSSVLSGSYRPMPSHQTVPVTFCCGMWPVSSSV